MFNFNEKTFIIILLYSLSFGQTNLSDPLNVVDNLANDVSGTKFLSISTAKFFEGPEGKKTRKILESGIEHSIGMIIPTSFVVENETVFIPSVPTSEIKSFSKTGDFIKSYRLQCAETCEPNYFSFLQGGYFLVNSWGKSDLRVVDTANGRILAQRRACSLKNWIRKDDFILCEKGLIWRDDKSIFLNQNKLNRPLTNCLDYYFLDSTLVISVYVDDKTKELMYQLVDSQQEFKSNQISLPVEIDDYWALHIIDGNKSYVRFLLLSNDYRQDKIVLFDFCSKKHGSLG